MRAMKNHVEKTLFFCGSECIQGGVGGTKRITKNVVDDISGDKVYGTVGLVLT